MSSVLAQVSSLNPKPQVGITVFSDGKPANKQTGIKADTREIRFRALLHTKADSFFSDFKQELVIKNTEVILARNNRQLARTSVADGSLPINMIRQAQPTDHLIFKFMLAAQRKSGDLVPLAEQPVYSFPIRK
jgi:hypothetical protein